MKLIYILIFFCTISVSCNKFLDEPSSKTDNIQPTKVEHLEALLNNYGLLSTETNIYATYASDDMGTYPELLSETSAINIEQTRIHLWDNILATTDTKKASWTPEWEKIFLANMIKFFIEKVEGGEAEKNKLGLEATFMRAYSYMKLVDIYCLPYTNATKGELGLPIKRTTSFIETDKRATLEETYNFIEGDLLEILEITSKIEESGAGIYNSWRANKGAAYALNARYWLMRGDYKKSLDFATKALSEHNLLVDYNKDMRYSNIDHSVTVGKIKYDLDYPYTFDNSHSDLINALQWKEFYYFRLLQESYSWFMPSESLIACYDQENDLRFKYHFVDNYSFVKSLKTINKRGYIFFFNNAMPSGLGVSEMIVTKAECEVRLDQWVKGIETVNILRSKRMLPGNDLVSISKEDALSKVLEERRREMPFAMRWFDLRRLNHNDDISDDVVVEKIFFPYSTEVNKNEPTQKYTLPNGSLHYAYPIPQDDITATQGTLQQNKY